MLVKRIIQEDFQKMYTHLTEYNYSAILMEHEMSLELKHIHKAAYIFYLWKIELNKNGTNSEHLNEIISTFTQIIYVSIYKDIKILFMLYRNIIDNFIKLIREYFTLDSNLYTLEIFQNVMEHSSTKRYLILAQAYNRILHVYKIGCGYVHSTEEKFLSLHENLRFYLEGENREFKKCIKTFCDLIKSINYILIYYYQDIYETFSVNDKKLVNYFCNKKDLRTIYKDLYGVNY